MANLLLTTTCVRSCPYCFAKSEMKEANPGDLLSWENLIYLADFLALSTEKHISLLGGEPTLHPSYVDFVLYLLERGFHITTFTSGILSPGRLEELKQFITPLPVDRLNFVCNLNDPEQTPASEKEQARISAFLSLMGPWTIPGFTIYRTDFDLKFIFENMSRYGLQRQLRLGIASPTPGHDNQFIDVNQHKQVVDRLYSFKKEIEQLRVRPSLDCGFPLCAFSDEQLGWLYRHTRHVYFECGPTIDITPNLDVYNCFPLSRFHKRSIFEFTSFKEVIDYYQDLHNKVRKKIPGMYAECGICPHREERRCAGGGLCNIMHRFIEDIPA